MSGWLLILALLVLGGVLSTLGDRLGSRVGKARLSLFNLRPRNTAVVITVLTGSLISAVSLGLMLLVSERLRVGLFQLDQIQDRLRDSRLALQRNEGELQRTRGALDRSRLDLTLAERRRDQALASQRRARDQLLEAEGRVDKLRRELQPLQAERHRLEAERARLNREVQGRDAEIRRTEAELATVRQRIAAGEKELRDLEKNVIALRRGDVVIASGQPLATAKVQLQRPDQARQVIDALLQEANRAAFQQLLPGQPPNRQILLVPRSDISRLESLLGSPGVWVVSIRSAANVLRGEGQVLAFPDLRPNRQVVEQGEVLARTSLEADVRDPEAVRSRLNLLLTAAFAKVQRQGTLANGLQFDPAAFTALARDLSDRPAGQNANLEALATRSADTPDPITVELRWLRNEPGPTNPRR
ncbi:MAG: polynucleotidyl transferase [Cyanobium sp. CACIAM 14]|nr:MAG: polynucleotidyl transferase [Cyanobium sp. CACIAM 14]